VTPTVLEEDALQVWLVSYLEADAALSGMVNGVAPEVVPGSLASPFIRVDRLEGNDLMVIGLHRVWADTLWHVRACFHWTGGGQPDRTDVNAIGFRIDQLLHDTETQTTEFSIHSFREDPEPTPATVETNGELWLQSGGLYRMRAAQI